MLVASTVLLSFGAILVLPKVMSRTSEVRERQSDDDADLLALRAHKKWQLVNPTRQFMKPNVAQLCGRNFGREEESPHLNKYISVYVNDVGRKAMMTEFSPKFPVGTMIVKEKFGSLEEKAPELITAMIKRSAGYNPETGDWEYFLVDGAATKIEERGKLENCMACHTMYKQSDFVIRSYLPAEVREKLKGK
jgi:hypothetical protein